jgi:hypothetical protein
MSGATRIASLLAALIGTITLAFADDVDLDAQIADAKHAATAASKAAETICYNAGYAMSQRDQGLPNNAGEQSKKCTDAMQASNDASGFVGYLYERRSHLTGQPMPSEYACSGKSSLGAPHPDDKGHYTICPKDPDDHSYKFWIITQARMQVGSTKETWSDGGLISMRHYSSESECRMGIAKYASWSAMCVSKYSSRTCASCRKEPANNSKAVSTWHRGSTSTGISEAGISRRAASATRRAANRSQYC